ncbi:MAG: hypothetical protein ACT4PY_17315 [Armatimonadota bacterium]
MWTSRVGRAFPAAILIGVVMGLIAGAVPAAAQTRSLSGVRVLAVAPFADDNPETRQIAEQGSIRLGEILKRGRFQVIEPARVAEEMKRLGIGPSDLVSPTRAIALGQSLGADAVLTGRVVQIRRDKGLTPGFGAEARMTVDVRILDVASRLKLFQQEVTCSDFSGSLTGAANCFARDVGLLLLMP